MVTLRDRVVAQQLARGLRDEHLAAVPCCADAGRAVDAEADVALAAHGRLARVDAHADPELASPSGQSCSASRRWHAIGSSDGVLGPAEGDEERVALRVDLVAAVLGEGLAQDPLMVVERLAVALPAAA